MKTFYIKFLPIISLCCLGLLVYSDTFYNSFHFDDFPSIVHNVSIKNIHHPQGIWNFWPTRFISYFSFALNYHWGGLDVFGYHLLSLLIHLGTSILVWRLVSLTLKTPAPWIAFFSGAIFLVHPLQTQPVNYIFQRAALLAAFFYLGSLTLYVKSRLTYLKDPDPRTWMAYFTGSLFMACLSMFSKETAITLPFIICLYEFCFLKNKGKRSWPWLMPFFMAALLLPFTWIMTHPDILKGTKQVVENYAGGITVGQYFLTQLKVAATYLRLIFIPLNQAVDYDYPLAQSIFEVPVILSSLLLLVILFTAFKILNKFKLPAFGIFWFFITLLPESSIWPNRDLIFEHRLYLPMAGFSIFLSSGLFYFFNKKMSTLAIRTLFLLIFVYSFLTYQRNKVWENEFTLWDDAVHKSPRDQRAYLNRGAAYQEKGDLDSALADYNMVIGLGAVTAVTLSNRGAIFKDKGAFDLALANFNLAIKINPSYAGTYNNRGLLYTTEGKLDPALADFNKAIELIPNDAQAYANRARVYFLKQEYVKGRQDLRKAELLDNAFITFDKK